MKIENLTPKNPVLAVNESQKNNAPLKNTPLKNTTPVVQKESAEKTDVKTPRGAGTYYSIGGFNVATYPAFYPGLLGFGGFGGGFGGPSGFPIGGGLMNPYIGGYGGAYAPYY